MIASQSVLNHVEQPACFIFVCAVLMYVLTSIQAIPSIQPSNTKGDPRMHWPDLNQTHNGSHATLSVTGSVNNISTPDEKTSLPNRTDVCSSGPCSVDKEHSPNTNITANINNRKWDTEALLRGSYVFLGLSAIVCIYAVWKSIRRKNNEVHRYGVIPNTEDMELAHLDSDDGEDDTTHFDLSTHKIK